VAGVVAALVAVAAGLVLSRPGLVAGGAEQVPTWTAADVALLRTLSVDALPDRPEDPSNAFAADPGAAALGRLLFHDVRLSAGQRLSCASCHKPELAFTDGLHVAQGQAIGQRNTPTLPGAAFQRTFNWDGRIDTLWGQALGPIEHAAEMGSSRGDVARLVAGDPTLRSAFERVFGPLDAHALATLPAGPCGPVAAAGDAAREGAASACWRRLPERQRAAASRVFVNVGKAIAAHEASLRPPASRFDQFVRELAAGSTPQASTRLTAAEQRGLRLFITPARTACLNCHNGPMFSNGGFHDIGTNLGPQSTGELGRMLGERLMETSEFRCDGIYSDALPEQCLQARFQNKELAGEGRGAFKVPTLRGVAVTAPYMHDGRFADLQAVMQHYRSPPLASVSGAHELRPIELSVRDIDDLIRFLAALSAPALDAPP
jgi:cytochrome c peroxidase